MRTVLLGLVLIVVLAVLWVRPLLTSSPSRLVRFSAVATNRGDTHLRQVAVRFFAPGSGHPGVPPLKTDPEMRIIRDDLENIVLESVLDLPPYAQRIISVQAELPLVLPSSVPNPEMFLQAEALIESDDPEIRQIAQSLRRRSAEETARAIYEFVAGAIEDDGFHADDRGARWALKNHTGDCTEYASLATALLRASGIPARRVGGFIMPTSGVVRPAQYHNWAEFYDRAEWRILDAQKRVFDTQNGYAPFRILGAGESAPLPNSHRFITSDPGVELRLD